LPRFVEQEFRDFLQCGWLAGGFARFRCGACGLDRLVPFSCKGRGFCPSCGGRRMAERAAHLVDHVLPDVPVRQWVLSVPHRLRYQLAWDHDLCRAVVAVYMRAVLGWLRRRARGDGVLDGRGGAVAVIQRFGGALNLNLHVHALVLDGVFARDRAGGLGFHPAPRLAALDVAEVLATVEPRIKGLLDRFGVDVLACPRCGGRLRLIALIEEAAAIERILRHLGLPTTIPAARPARAPPVPVRVRDAAGWDDATSAFDPCS